MANGATAPNVRSKITVRANATRVCARVGGKFKSETEVLSAITDTTILAHGTLLVQTVMKPQLVFRKIDLAQTPPLMSALCQKRTLLSLFDDRVTTALNLRPRTLEGDVSFHPKQLPARR